MGSWFPSAPTPDWSADEGFVLQALLATTCPFSAVAAQLMHGERSHYPAQSCHSPPSLSSACSLSPDRCDVSTPPSIQPLLQGG